MAAYAGYRIGVRLTHESINQASRRREQAHCYPERYLWLVLTFLLQKGALAMDLLDPSLPEPPITDFAYPAFVSMLRGAAAFAGMLPHVTTMLL